MYVGTMGGGLLQCVHDLVIIYRHVTSISENAEANPKWFNCFKSIAGREHNEGIFLFCLRGSDMSG